MTTTHAEREAKFEGTGVFDPQELRRLPGVADLREETAEELDAIYYDTADLRLLTRGVTLRRRTGGHDAGWHVKLPAQPGDGGGSREIHAPLRAGKAGHVPRELARRLAVHARGGDLVPVAHLRTHRRRHLLLDKKGRLLAEVAQDQVAAQVLGAERIGTGAVADGSAGTSTRLTHWFELEVELEDGRPALLEAAARVLAAAGWHPSPSAHKLDHALAEELPASYTSGERDRKRPARGGRPRPGSAGEAVMARLDAQVTVLTALDPGVRADEPDAVHAMRTAARRIRTLLRGHARLLDRTRTDPVVSELAWLTSLLAPARDHEVLAVRLPAHARKVADAYGADVPGLGGLAKRIARQERALHDSAWRAAVETLDGARYFALLDALDALCAEPPLRKKARRPAVEQLRRTAARDHRRLVRRIAAAESAPAGSERDLALHAARKAARRARHTAETAVPYAGKKARRLRKHSKAVQQVLGEHQDAVVARAALPALAADAHRTGATAYGYGLLHAYESARLQAAERRLPAAARKALRSGPARLR